MIKQRKFLWLIVVLLFLTNFFVWQEVFDLTNPDLEVVFFDVGQGDAIFIETPQGHQILIDGGFRQDNFREISNRTTILGPFFGFGHPNSPGKRPLRRLNMGLKQVPSG